VKTFWGVDRSVMEVEGPTQPVSGHVGDALGLDVGARPVIVSGRPSTRSGAGKALVPGVVLSHSHILPDCVARLGWDV
jgi:hypothetical protein